MYVTDKCILIMRKDYKNVDWWVLKMCRSKKFSTYLDQERKDRLNKSRMFLKTINTYKQKIYNTFYYLVVFVSSLDT